MIIKEATQIHQSVPALSHNLKNQWRLSHFLYWNIHIYVSEGRFIDIMHHMLGLIYTSLYLSLAVAVFSESRLWKFRIQTEDSLKHCSLLPTKSFHSRMLFSRTHSLRVISIWCGTTWAVYGMNDCWMIYQVANRNPVGLGTWTEWNKKKCAMCFSTWDIWWIRLGELEDFGKNFPTSCHLRVTTVFIQRSEGKKSASLLPSETKTS